MNKEEAIYQLRNTAWLGTHEDREKTEKAVEMAISALEQEPCEDAISRADMYEEIEDWLNLSRYYHPNSKNNKMPIDELRARIERLPSVTPSRRKGHWIVLSSTDMYCSECNEVEELNTKRKYCSWCGARMESEDKE